MKKNYSKIPEANVVYKFFDGGKIRENTIYDATVKFLLTKEQAKEHTLYFPNKNILNLYDFWQEEINNHINRENFHVLPAEIGEPWLYARDTDFFVFCKIPGYSDYPVIFVRDIHGGWFSLGYPYSFDGGVLYVTGELYDNIKK